MSIIFRTEYGYKFMISNMKFEVGQLIHSNGEWRGTDRIVYGIIGGVKINCVELV